MTGERTIPKRLVELLIELDHGLGVTPSSSYEAILSELVPHDDINRLHWHSWDAATDGLSVDDHEALVRGLAMAEKGLRWCGGSVSAVIWTYRSFERKAQQRANALADWILEYSDNPYEPFGYSRGTARSFDAVRRQNETRKARSEAHKERELQQQKEAVIRRRDRAAAADEHNRTQEALSAERAELITRLRTATLAERLKHIVCDATHPLSWYPDAWAELTDAEVSELPVALVDGLEARLADRKRGPWRQLYKRLIGMPAARPAQHTFSGDTQ